MNKIAQFTMVGLLLLLLNGCKQETEPFDEHVFAVQLVDDTSRIEEYLDYHTRVWPEVETGFKKAGYEKIRLFRFGNYLCMIVQVPKGASLEDMGKNKALSTAKVREWNRLMATYQRGLSGTREGTTWVEMEKIYEFNKNR